MLIYEIMQDDKQRLRVRVGCESTLTFAEFLGWFAELLGMEEFFKVEPVILITVSDSAEVIFIASKTEGLGFELLTPNDQSRPRMDGSITFRTYIFKFKFNEEKK